MPRRPAPAYRGPRRRNPGAGRRPVVGYTSSPWSGDPGQHFLGEQRNVVQIVEIEHLEVDRLGAEPANSSSRATTSSGVPATPLARNSSALRPMLAARRSTSAASVPQQTVWAADRRSVAGSRPLSSQAARTRANWASVSATDEKGRLNSSA